MRNKRLPWWRSNSLKKAVLNQNRLWMLAGVLWVIVCASQYSDNNQHFALLIVTFAAIWYYLHFNNMGQQALITESNFGFKHGFMLQTNFL